MSPRSIPIVIDSCLRFVFVIRFGLRWELLRFFMTGVFYTSSGYSRELIASCQRPAGERASSSQAPAGPSALGQRPAVELT